MLEMAELVPANLTEEHIGFVLGPRLKEFRLDIETPVETYSTPRRLTARIGKVAERQTDLEDLLMGHNWRLFAARGLGQGAAMEEAEELRGTSLPPQERRRACRTE